MSRIHDALRREQRPETLAAPQRTVRADAVLAALGYRPDAGSARRVPVLVLLAAAVTLTAVLGMAYWSVSQRQLTAHVATNVPSTPSSSEPPRNSENLLAPDVVPRPALATASAVAAATGHPQTAMKGATAAPTTITEFVVRAASRATTGNRPSQAPAARPVPRDQQPVHRVTESAPDPEAASAADSSDFQLALYYQRAGDVERAQAHYRKVLQRDELNIGARNNLGILFQTRGLYEDAAREFQRVVAINPHYVTAHLNLSAALLELGRADAAAAEARAVLAIEPRQSDALVNLGLAQGAAGQTGEAKLSLRRALEIDPHHAAAHYNLAQAYEKSGEPGLAVDHYRQFLQFAGTEQTAYVADVRARIQALTRGRRP